MKPVSTMGSGDLGREVDLDQLVAELEANELVTEANFHGPSMVTVRLSKGGPAITVYRTGSYQIRGTEDRDSLFEMDEKFRRALEKIDLQMNSTGFEQQNAVFLGNLDQALNLETLALQLGLENVEYEPEQFPGLIYRPNSSNNVLLIFASGKVIISGLTDRSAAEENLSHLQEKVN